MIKIASLQLFDKVLLGIVVISLILNIIKEIVITSVNEHLRKIPGTKCRFLYRNEQGKYTCINEFYNHRYFEENGGICSQSSCRGYYSNTNIEDILSTHWIYPYLSVSISVISQLSSVVLIIRTLLEVTR